MRTGHFELNVLDFIINERASTQDHKQQCLPLANSEVTWRTATQVAALRVGAAITAGGLWRATLVDVLAPSAELLVLEAGRTHALVAPQGVVAGGPSANVSTEAFVLICRKNQKTRRMASRPEVSSEESGPGPLLPASWPSLCSQEGKAGRGGWDGERKKRERYGNGCGLLSSGKQVWPTRSNASGGAQERLAFWGPTGLIFHLKPAAVCSAPHEHPRKAMGLVHS